MFEFNRFIESDGYCSDPCEDCPTRLLVDPHDKQAAMLANSVIVKYDKTLHSRDVDSSEVYALTYGVEFPGFANDSNEPAEFNIATDAIIKIMSGGCSKYSDKYIQ